MWGILHEKELLRREPTIRDALDWIEGLKGDPRPNFWVQKYKTDTKGIYDLCTSFGDYLGELRRVDPKGVIAEYPSPSMPKFRLDAWQIDMAEVARHGGSVDLEYGHRAPIIVALHSVGWTERQIAEALFTSRTYVMRVILKPSEFLSEYL